MNLQQLTAALTLASVFVICMVLPEGSGRASPYSDALLSYRKAVATYDSSSIEDAIRQFDAIIMSNPADGRALVYKGSLLSALAKAAWMPWNKLRYVNEGIDLMDRGIAVVTARKTDAHTEIEVRMVRGITSAKIPTAFRRSQVAEGDFKIIRMHPGFSMMSAEDKSTVLAYQAVLARRAGDNNKAEKLLKEAQDLNNEIANNIWSQK